MVFAFAWREEVEQFADLSPGGLDVTGLCFAQEMFEFGEHLLDRIEVWTIGRQENEMRAFSADGTAGCFAFVAAEIGEDLDVALGQRRGAGFSSPVSRRSLFHLEMHDGLIWSASAIARTVSPASARQRPLP